MSNISIYYINNDNLLELSGLTDAANSIYLNVASVSVTLVDTTSSAEVTGETWPLSMAYVSGSNGVYRAILDASLSVTPSQELTAIIEIDGGNDDLEGEIRLPVLALYRTGV